MDLATITPAHGIKPGSRLRYSRGYLIDGKAHAVEGVVTASNFGTERMTTVCGLVLMPTTIFAQGIWPKFLAGPNRTHETGVCLRCVTKTEQAREANVLRIADALSASRVAVADQQKQFGITY